MDGETTRKPAGLRAWFSRRLATWRGAAATGAGCHPEPTRWVVADVETTGLDPKHDRLLAIAAVAVEVGSGVPELLVGDTFEVVLRHSPATTDKANILIHQIGVGAQRAGVEPVAGLEAFERWVGDSPLVAFHAAFDEAVIGRAMRQHLGRPLRPPWVDLAAVAQVAQPEVPARSLDEWMAHAGIVCAVRHQAAADTWATAELLARLWPAIRRQTQTQTQPVTQPFTQRVTHRSLRALEANLRWLRSR